MSNIITNRDILVNKDLIEHVLNHQWVDTNVRLPKEHFNDGYQLVFIIRQIDDDTMIYETDYIKNGEWELSKGKAGKVTYWMNIPKVIPVKNVYTEKMNRNKLPLYYIVGDEIFGPKLIQLLIDKGGLNKAKLEGTYLNYYFIGKNNVIKAGSTQEAKEVLEQYGTQLTLKFTTEFNTFDRVLVRNGTSKPWKAGIFSYYFTGSSYPYVLLDNESYKYCIHYNDDTKILNNKISNIVK